MDFRASLSAAVVTLIAILIVGAARGGAAPVSASTLSSPKTPDLKADTDGFLRRWLVLEPIAASGLTDNIVQAAVRRKAVALLGDRDGHDTRRGCAQPLQDLLGILRCDQDLAQSADDLVGNLGIERYQGIQTVLGGQSVADIGAAQRDRADSPLRVMSEQIFNEPCLVRAMECAGSEVHDARGEAATVVARTLHLRGEAGQNGLRERVCHISGWAVETGVI